MLNSTGESADVFCRLKYETEKKEDGDRKCLI